MPAKRLGAVQPSASANLTSYTLLSTVDITGVASVIVANKGNIDALINIYVEPVDTPGNPATWVFVASNLSVGVGQTFETFRFALKVGDKIFVAATTDSVGFSASAVYETEGRLNVVYQTTEPGFPEVGDIWIDSADDSISVYTGTSFQTVATAAPIGPTGPEGPIGPTGPIGVT